MFCYIFYVFDNNNQNEQNPAQHISIEFIFYNTVDPAVRDGTAFALLLKISLVIIKSEKWMFDLLKNKKQFSTSSWLKFSILS